MLGRRPGDLETEGLKASNIAHENRAMPKLGGGFKYCLFSPLVGEDSHFDKYFSNGLKSPTRKGHVIFQASICQGLF